jgi:hypothetical protein
MRDGSVKTLNRTAVVLAAAVLLAGTAGCRVHVDKSANGQDKNVQVDTPFGGVHVNTNQTTAADLGLPVYPGAQLVEDKDHDKSADVHLGFGKWELRVKAVSYATADKQEQVVAFYKKALGRFGDVLTCQENTAVGKPTVTSEGLTCEDHKNMNVQIGNESVGAAGKGLELKAGSKSHQHIVGFEEAEGGRTRFSLVSLDLPEGTESDSAKSD